MKLNVNETLEKAERDGLIYPAKGSWKKLFIFAGVLTCLLVITIPLGIWIIFVAKKSRVGLTEEGFAFKGLGSYAWRWDAVEEFRLAGSASMTVHGGGLVGALAGAALSGTVAAKTQGLKGPLRFKIKGQRVWKILPAHTIQNSLEMAVEMEKRTGLLILPKQEDAPAAPQNTPT